MSKNQIIFSWVLRIIIIGILAYAVYPKWMATEDEIALFSVLPGQTTLMYVTAALETIAIILLLIPASTAWGALLAGIVMIGAISSHIMYLGFAGIAGMFAAMAVGVLVMSIIVMWMHRDSLPMFGGSSGGLQTS